MPQWILISPNVNIGPKHLKFIQKPLVFWLIYSLQSTGARSELFEFIIEGNVVEYKLKLDHIYLMKGTSWLAATTTT